MSRSRKTGTHPAILCALLALGASSAGASEERMLESYRESARHFEAAAAAARRGDLEVAQQSYEQAIGRDPAFVEAMVNLARLHLAQGRTAEATVWLDRAEQQRADYPKIAATRGLVASHLDDEMRAVEALSRAQRMAPDDTEVGVNLGALLIARGRLDEARRTLQRVLRHMPDSPEALYNLALAEDLAGRLDEAIYGYQRFLALSNHSDPQREAVARRLEILSGAGAVSAPAVPEVSLDSEARSPKKQEKSEMQGRENDARKRARGFTLIEILVAVAILAILSAALTPLVVKYINDGRRARALSDSQTLGQTVLAFNIDNGIWPVNDDANINNAGELSRLVGLPAAQIAAAAIAGGDGTAGTDAWSGAGDGGNAGAIEDQLIRNQSGAVTPLYPVSQTAPEPAGWNGPYLKQVPMDPWGRPYVCNVRYFANGNVTGVTPAEANNHAVMCLSAGPDGLYNTVFADATELGGPAGDDIGWLIQGDRTP